jgi:hypothetical protein
VGNVLICINRRWLLNHWQSRGIFFPFFKVIVMLCFIVNMYMYTMVCHHLNQIQILLWIPFSPDSVPWNSCNKIHWSILFTDLLIWFFSLAHTNFYLYFELCFVDVCLTMKSFNLLMGDECHGPGPDSPEACHHICLSNNSGQGRDARLGFWKGNGRLIIPDRAPVLVNRQPLTDFPVPEVALRAPVASMNPSPEGERLTAIGLSGGHARFRRISRPVSEV